MAEPRILIANRGEIAVRVIRACGDLGIRSIAVYSDADRDALFVDMADEAYHLGPAAPAESYLSIPRILEVAARAGATMVHPGYGFLSERAEFARACAEAGLTFIGPPPEAMQRMGDKAAARRTADEVGAPTIPGTPEPISPDRAEAEAGRIGFPLVVKAAFGGGGKGMRLVEDPGQLQDAVTRSAREAQAYFGRPEVYLERYLRRAHHVEAQILADKHGHVSFFGERDCSAQRRYQKLVEESPSPVVDDGLRSRIGEAAIAIAKGAGYENAGTVEFLVDESGEFFFIEMNARLQVEHPVSEFVARYDLVRLQIEAALGDVVDVSPTLRGHAIECRINAEDPGRDFLPGPGLITDWFPPGGPFVRLDTGVFRGRRVVGDYDSLIAKLIVWGSDRPHALQRMLRALGEFRVEGISTTIPFHRWLLDTPEFREGSVHTKWIEEALAGGRFSMPEAAAIGAGASPVKPVKLLVEVDGHRVPVNVWGDSMHLPPAPPTFGAHAAGHADGGEMVTAPMQGTILQVLVAAGQEVTAGQTICILEAMKMENHVAAVQDGVIAELLVTKGDVVDSGQALAILE